MLSTITPPGAQLSPDGFTLSQGPNSVDVGRSAGGTVTSAATLTIPVKGGDYVTVRGAAGAAGTVQLLNAAGAAILAWTIAGGAPLFIGPAAGSQRYIITVSAASAAVSVDAGVLELLLNAPVTNIPQGNRMPGPADNALYGYAASSVWQNRAQIFKPVAAPDNTAAVWGIQPPSAANPVTVLGANAIFIGGLVAAKPGSLVKLCDISVTIAATPTTFTLFSLVNGELDIAAFDAAASRADAGTVVTCIKLYDQGPAGNDFVPHSGNPAPYVRWSTRAGRYVLAFDSQGSAITPRTLQAPAGVIVAGSLTTGYGVVGNSWSTMIIGSGLFSSDNSGRCFPYVFGDNQNPTTADRRFMGLISTIAGEICVNRNGAAAPNTPKVLNDSQLAVTLCGTGTGNVLFTSVNEDESSGTVSADTFVYTSGYIGCYDPLVAQQSASTHEILLLVNSNTNLTAAQKQMLRYGVYCRFDIRPQVRDSVFVIGDSRPWGALPANLPVTSMAMLLADKLGKTARVFNLGIRGITSAGLRTNITTTAIGAMKTGARNVGLLLFNVNDFIASAMTPAQSLADMKTTIALLKTASMRLVLINGMTTTVTTNSANTFLATLTGLITAAGPVVMGVDRITEVGVYTPAASPSNTAYYATGGLHPTAELCDMVMAACLSDVQAMLSYAS